MKSTIVDLFTYKDAYQLFTAAIVAIGTLTTLSYFIYTREQKGAMGISGKIGRLFMMSSFGIGWAVETLGMYTTLTIALQMILIYTVQALQGKL